jgi:hypothetical protein
MTIAQALMNLRPNSNWSMNNEIITWEDTEQTEPTQAEIDAEVIRLQAEYDANQHQRDRQSNYPNLAEQFDLLWHAIDADTLDKTSDFYTTLKAVKDAHPKG